MSTIKQINENAEKAIKEHIISSLKVAFDENVDIHVEQIDFKYEHVMFRIILKDKSTVSEVRTFNFFDELKNGSKKEIDNIASLEFYPFS
ncbi:hypothetical protein [Vibrio sp. D431a]|uniref:hypothetical protein n=1 Tax=Vibrio sp. D431a TaxID=2837388 RepID=UPI002555E69E|nr:hypothetical protein [Vibrio sp. D431a]MDK9789813.1 hypothetical protein [Vibrio sp. D431a]